MDFYEFKEYSKEKFPYHGMRSQQEVLMGKIYECVTNKKNLVVEAPTGVGKTLSYLIPALYFAERGKRVMILTETIDQQERIVEDLNSLKHNLKVSFMMGKGNFFCKSKGEKANTLYCQLNKGCIYRPNKKPVCVCGTKKEKIEFDGNIKFYCPLCMCDYQKAKIECFDANIIVMNNTIYYYLKDEIDKKKQTDIVICDEAHKLEGSIRNAATIVINPKYALRRLRFMAYHYSNSRLRVHMDRVSEEEDEIFWTIVQDYVVKNAAGKDCKNSLVFDGFKITSFGLKEDVAILGTLLEGYNDIVKIKEKIEDLNENEELDKKDLKFKIDNKGLIPLELQFIADRRISDVPLVEFLENLGNLRNITGNFVVYKNNGSILCEPVLVSNYLNKLYGDASVVHCSATLGDLNIHAIKTGMGKSETLLLDSPFSKDRRNIISLSDGEDMKFNSTDFQSNNKKRNKANENLFKMVKAAKGNTLILFKSFGDLKTAHEYFLDAGYRGNIYCYESGMDGKAAKKLKEDFQKYGGLLLATGRFAEGVDIPGDALTCVIIDSLPFPVPTPLLKREQTLLEERLKSRKVKDAHWSAFLMTSFHIMARTVIQMIGRLIRTETDYGVVIIQDKRFNEWVGSEMLKRKYLKDKFLPMSVDTAEEYIPKFMKKMKEDNLKNSSFFK
ncbi:ATP-dependent DNA helicase [Methanococcus maripaludis]|uniref:ATP-dependent DNA helicase DinG n=2 Tax=Methanococcus maripaludis TaxID=39152 RepID=A0A7J9PEM1_METMI|nr:ATP-dependent DNA helicase [Methanococcus maripaludis]MBA2861186.1 ATP-dependent DNA helicase DinG [Methanococcus maripaludis]